MWARIEPLLSCWDGQRGRPFREHRQVVEGVVYRLRTAVPWRDLPVEFGPWQTGKRHNRFARWGGSTGNLPPPLQSGPLPPKCWSSSSSGRGRRVRRASHRGVPAIYKVLPDPRHEAGDHGIGRSRGGLTTTCHAPVDGHGLPLVTPGQARDSKMLGPLRVPRVGPGRARTRPVA